MIEFERFTLDNGLRVIFYHDPTTPMAVVNTLYDVGARDESPERTGFAHLFEHLLFLESENLGKGGLDKLSARIGGSGANGSTSRDRTNYFQTVPKDALEKMIWAEADKLGYFINTVTEPVLAKEKQVVKNAAAMAEVFVERGFDVVSGGTKNHLFLVSLIKQDITGKDADAALGRAHITVNKNAVPNDPRSPFVTSGLRIGTPAVTTRGFGESECRDLAGWMCDILDNLEDEAVIGKVREQAEALCARFPVYTG
jgi:hypothetical protein